MASPKGVIPAPAPIPPKLSLLSSAIEPTDDARWEGGFTYEVEDCGTGSVFIVDPCEGPPGQEKTLDTTDNRTITFDTYIIGAGDRCSTFGSNARDWEARARRKLAACESRQIARELWRGDVARANAWDNRYFTNNFGDDGADVVSDVGGETAVNALAMLEGALASCGCGERGMIHVTPQTAQVLFAANALRFESPYLLTANGTIIVADAGYDGSGPNLDPDGAPVAPGNVWAYATSMVYVRRAPVVVLPGSLAEAINRSTNTVEVRAERTAAAYFGCCLFAAELTDIDVPNLAGTGS